MVKPDLRRCNPAREDPEWFNQILPAARVGGARLALFARRPLGVALAPTAILNLLSMRLGGRQSWSTSNCVAELFVPGLQDRMSPDLIPKTWRAREPVRLVDARTILLAAMAAFFDNVGRAFAQITDAARATMGPTIDRWLCGLQPYSRELLTEHLWSHRASTAVSYLLQS